MQALERDDGVEVALGEGLGEVGGLEADVAERAGGGPLPGPIQQVVAAIDPEQGPVGVAAGERERQQAVAAAGVEHPQRPSRRHPADDFVGQGEAQPPRRRHQRQPLLEDRAQLAEDAHRRIISNRAAA